MECHVRHYTQPARAYLATFSFYASAHTLKPQLTFLSTEVLFYPSSLLFYYFLFFIFDHLLLYFFILVSTFYSTDFSFFIVNA